MLATVEGEDVEAALACAHSALELVEQLSFRRDSHFWASLQGGPQFIGYTADVELAADTRDLMLAILSGLSGSRMSADELWPRPKAEEVKPQRAETIADFDMAQFARWLYT